MRRTRGSRSLATSESMCVRRSRMIASLAASTCAAVTATDAVAEIALDDAVGERVDEPGMALGEVVDARHGLGLEALAGGGGVLERAAPSTSSAR